MVDCWPSEARAGQFTQFTLPTIVKQALVRPHGDAVHSQLVHNVSFNPATGANYPFTDISHRPFPEWGIVAMELLEGRSNLHSLQTVFTKRFSGRWQATANYTLSGFWDAQPLRDQYNLGADGIVARKPIGFAVAPDLNSGYGQPAFNSNIAYQPRELQLGFRFAF